MISDNSRRPSLIDALFPVIMLAALLSLGVYLFGEDASWGPNQIALTLTSLVAATIGLKNGFTWAEMSDGVVKSISQAMGAIFILLAVGGLIGTWVMSGTVATMIHMGLGILSPSLFYPTAIIVCGLVSASIGSSWTTVGTIGIGLIGIANGMGLSEGAAAGAIICGAYFGDKISPLSDTTNLAPAVAGTDLFTHIRHMMWTTVPSLVITLVAFTFIGWGAAPGGDSASMAEDVRRMLEANFTIGWVMLIPLALVMVLAIAKMPPFPTIIIGALAGGVIAVLFQPEQVLLLANRPDLPEGLALTAGVWHALYAGFESSTGVTVLDTLLSRGGMASMLEVIWMVLTALMFGGVMETTGKLQRIVDVIMKGVRGTGSLVTTTVLTGVATNIIASDQYMAIVLPGRMYRAEFRKRNLAPENLSRAIEDSGTITSPLVPWNTCGAYMAGTLGVATLTYLPFCFFNILSPIISIAFGLTGFTIKKINEE